MGYVYIFLAAACWGLLGPIARIAFAEGVSPLEVAFWRAALGGLAFGGHILVTKAALPKRNDYLAVAGFGAVCVGLFYAAYQFAVDTGGATLAAVLLYTAPAWVAVMSLIWLRERISGMKLAAIVITLLGVAGLSFGGGGTIDVSTAAVFWGLLAGFCYALYYPFGKVYFARYEPAAIYALALPLGAILLLFLVDFSGKSALAWMAILIIATVSTYGAYWFYGRAMQRLEASRASILATLEPVVAGFLAFWWWNEALGLAGYVGAILILTGVVIAIAERSETIELSSEPKA